MELIAVVLALLLWIVCLIGDLRQREVPIWALIALSVVSLLGQPWPWWVLVTLTLAWPSRKGVIVLAPVAIAAGVLLEAPAPGIAIAAGCVAWALGWWGGADSILLIALGMRYGVAGLISGAVATALAGVIVMIVRRRSLVGLLTVLPEAVSLQVRESAEIPVEAEMPAAAAMAVPGLLLSAYTLITLLSRGGA